MLKDKTRQKIHNVLVYFIENTNYCGKTKLFKLAHFLDFEHYSETGRSVTNLEYYAWPKGPVPVVLNDEIERQDETLCSAIAVSKRKISQKKEMFIFEPKTQFNPKLFTKRELRIIESLAVEYRNSTADEMIEATHLENLPWHQVYNIEGRKQQLIPYELAIKKSEYDLSIKLAIEHREFLSNYQ